MEYKFMQRKGIKNQTHTQKRDTENGTYVCNPPIK